MSIAYNTLNKIYRHIHDTKSIDTYIPMLSVPIYYNKNVKPNNTYTINTQKNVNTVPTRTLA